MAGTAKNFLTSAIDRMAEGAQNLGDWVSNKAQGLRSDTATPAAEPVERPLSGAARQAVHGQEYTRNMGPQAFAESPGNAASWTGNTNAAVDAEYGKGLREPARVAVPNPQVEAATAQGRTGPIRSPLDPRFVDPLADSNARIRAMNNPHLATDAGQQAVGRAQQFGSRPPPPPTGPAAASSASSFPEVPKASGGLRGLARGVARFAGPLAAASGVPDQLANGVTNMDEQIIQELGSPGFSPVSTPAGSAFRSVAGNALSLARRTGNALTLGLRGGDRVIGGIRDIAKGDLLGTTQFDEVAPRNAAPAQTAATNGQPPVSGGNYMAVDDGQAGTAQATPEAIIGSNLRPVAGTGVFKRTTPGNVGPAEGIGAPGDYRGENSYVASDRKTPGMRDAAIPGAPTTGGSSYGATQPGVFGELAAVQGMRQRLNQNQYGERMGALQRGQDITQRGQDLAAETTRRGQDLSAATARSQLLYEMGNNNRKNIESQIAAHADAMTPITDPLLSTSKGAATQRTEAKNQYANDLRSRIEWSLADRKDGRTMEQLSPTEFNQLLLMDKVRRKVEDKRSEVGQSVRDFFGNKRFNGQSLYGYGPTGVEPANDGGYVVKFGNGNTAKADIVGGDFQWLTPNAPVDADIQALVAPLIREARQRSR